MSELLSILSDTYLCELAWSHVISRRTLRIRNRKGVHTGNDCPAAAPQAREDRDLRCSARPFTASRVAMTAAYKSEKEFREAAFAAATAGSLYVIGDHGLRLILPLLAGRVDRSGVP